MSGLDHSHDGEERRLHEGSALERQIELDHRPMPVTLTVLDLTPQASMTLKSETPVLTDLETVTVTSIGQRAHGVVRYHLRAYSLVSSRVLNRWLDDHSDRVERGLRKLLIAAQRTVCWGKGLSADEP